MIQDRKFIKIVVLLCASVLLFNVVTKAFWVIIQVSVLKQYDDTTPLAHINAAAVLIGLMLTAFMPRFMELTSPRKLLGLFSGLSAFIVLMFPFLDTTFWGYVLTVGVLVFSGLNQIIALSIINASLTDALRTTFQGIYNTLYNASVGIGPLLVASLTPNLEYGVFAGLSMGLALMAVAFMRDKTKVDITKDSPKKDAPQKWLAGLGTLATKKTAFIIALITCLNMNMVSQLLVFWGDSYSLTLSSSKQLPAIFALGGTLLAIPLGFIADKIGCLKLFQWITIVMMVCFALLSLDARFEWIDYLSLFFLGGGIAAMVSIAFSVIGSHFKGKSLANATAGFAFLRLFLSIAGLYVAGEIIDQIEAYGLNLVMLILNGLLLIPLFKKRAPETSA